MLGKYYDYLIVGAGIVGLTVAYELIKRDSNLSIAVVEKENEVAEHASRINSGILQRPLQNPGEKALSLHVIASEAKQSNVEGIFWQAKDSTSYL